MLYYTQNSAEWKYYF